MRVIVDISHPAHFHFFKYAIEEWRRRGNEVLLVSRDKDITLELLDASGFEHQCLSKARSGVLGLGIELLEHAGKLYEIVKDFQPDVMVQIGGTFIVHVGRLTRTKAIVFYDTENATVSNLITYPFAHAICTPVSYIGEIGRKQVRYDGFQELAYLHPNWFVPDESVLARSGVSKGEKFSVLRFVGWESGHDVNLKGFSLEAKERLAASLAEHGPVFITSEAPLPPSLQSYEIKVPKDKVHDLLAFASLYIGESATMASESAILGTPAIFVSPVGRGYTDEQEKEYGLVFNYLNQDQDRTIEKAVELISTQDIKQSWLGKRDVMLQDKIDVTAWMVEFVEEFVGDE